jgi:phage antirepressor YoqD-like protein
MLQPNEAYLNGNNSTSQMTLVHETGSVFNYNGANITFRNENGLLMANATEMAKPFGKLPKDWLNTKQAKELINSLSTKRGIPLLDLVSVNQGGNNPGTWMYEDVALPFAQWLSTDFYLWCNDRIKELLTTGVTTVRSDDEAIFYAISVLQKRIDASQQRVQILEGENEHLTKEVKQLAPKAEYTDSVLQSTSTHTMTQVAKELGMSAYALEKKLHAAGVMFKQSGQWFLYAKYQDKGYTRPRTHCYPKSDGTSGTNTITVWTEAGRAFIHQLMKGGAL